MTNLELHKRNWEFYVSLDATHYEDKLMLLLYTSIYNPFISSIQESLYCI